MDVTSSSGGRRAISTLALLLFVGGGVAVAYWLLSADFLSAALLTGLAMIVTLLARDAQASTRLLSMLATTAVILNGLGYAYNLWRHPVWFDETVHLFTGLATLFGLGWLLYRPASGRARYSRSFIFFGLLGSGVALALLWEAFEWSIGRIDSTADTVVDVVMSTIGASIAALVWSALAARSSSVPQWPSQADAAREHGRQIAAPGRL